jgi:hypothetical protein
MCSEPRGVTLYKWSAVREIRPGGVAGQKFERPALAREGKQNGRPGISPDMAIRSPKAFGRSPESWLQLLPQYDLWQDEQRSDTIKVKHFATPAPC